MSEIGQQPLYSLQDVPGKGKGLIARSNIWRGTTIVDEPALFTTESLQDPDSIEADLRTIVRSLSRDEQRQFLSLHNNNPGPNPLSNIIRSNGYPCGPSSDIGGIFLETARINHSCRPNAQHSWNDKLKRMLVHAVRDIYEGDEITLSYVPGGPSAIRQESLKGHFGFDCSCELCSLPPKDRERSDRNFERAQKFDEAIGDSKRVKNAPGTVLAECCSLLDIYEQEQVFDLRLPRLYYDAFQICAMHSDQQRASIFAQRARELRIICEGEESVEAENLERLARDPKKFENFGLTSKWRSDLKGVQSQPDEEWLWRKRI